MLRLDVERDGVWSVRVSVNCPEQNFDLVFKDGDTGEVIRRSHRGMDIRYEVWVLPH